MPSQIEIAAFLAREFPQTKCTVESVGQMAATVKHEPTGLFVFRGWGAWSSTRATR